MPISSHRPRRSGPAYIRNVASERPDRPDLTDAAEQLRLVTAATFEKRRLLSSSETRVLYALEDAMKRSGRNRPAVKPDQILRKEGGL
jgi:hypothetical protein